jgi:hypothetical protein
VKRKNKSNRFYFEPDFYYNYRTGEFIHMGYYSTTMTLQSLQEQYPEKYDQWKTWKKLKAYRDNENS